MMCVNVMYVVCVWVFSVYRFGMVEDVEMLLMY